MICLINKPKQQWVLNSDRPHQRGFGLTAQQFLFLSSSPIFLPSIPTTRPAMDKDLDSVCIERFGIQVLLD